MLFLSKGCYFYQKASFIENDKYYLLVENVGLLMRVFFALEEYLMKIENSKDISHDN